METSENIREKTIRRETKADLYSTKRHPSKSLKNLTLIHADYINMMHYTQTTGNASLEAECQHVAIVANKIRSEVERAYEEVFNLMEEYGCSGDRK